MKSRKVSIKTRSTPASLTIQGQVTKDTTVKWSIITSFLYFVRLSAQRLWQMHLDQCTKRMTLFKLDSDYCNNANDMQQYYVMYSDLWQFITFMGRGT